MAAVELNGHDAALDAEEKAMEREPCPPEFPCPPEVWIGPWAEVAQLTGIADWRVWCGVTAALSARAHRNVHVSYYGPLYGMGYYLLVAKSSQGKSLCTRVCRALLPPDYEVFTSVESGQALAESLALITRDDHGKILTTESRPAALIISEWSLLLQNMGFHGSSLMERFNEIADAEPQVDLNRADKRGQGKVRIPNPTLTLCATTTVKSYQNVVKNYHVTSGFINRHLVLPGSRQAWRYNGAGEMLDLDAIRTYARGLPLAVTLGLGSPVSMLYTREAWDADNAFGQAFFEPLHNAEDMASEDVYKRLHVYARRLALLAAWSMGSPMIRRIHVKAAHAVVRTSYRFLQLLHEDQPDLTPTLQAKASLEERIVGMVGTEPGQRKESICNRLRRHGGYSTVSSTIENLLQAGALREDKRGEGVKKSRLIFLPSPS